METSHILRIMDLALRQDPRPFARLERGKPLARGRKEVAALSGTALGAGADDRRTLLIQAALYLCFDCFEEAHRIANDHEGTAAGNWVHAILHRREPDAGNSKYWYRRVKAPAKVWEDIGREALGLLKKMRVPELEPLRKKMEKSGTWEPEAFVDLCEEFRTKDPQTPAYKVLSALQDFEWKGLAEYVLTI
jgi:hypothetical protein